MPTSKVYFTDLRTQIGVSQLDKLDRFVARRREIVARYNEAFRRVPQLIVQEEIPESDTARHLYIIRLRPERLSIGRKEFFDALDAENVRCNVHYIPVYYFPWYRKLGYRKGICPKAEKLYEEILTIPLHYNLTDQDVEDVIRAVEKIVAYYAK